MLRNFVRFHSSASKLSIRVGRIVDVKQHSNADSLYVSQIDIGQEIPIQVCSGLVRFVARETLLNSKVAVVTNLKPSKMRGEVSQAMLLAAEKTVGEDTKVEPVTVPETAAIGERLLFDVTQTEEPSRVKPKQLPEALQSIQTDQEGKVIALEDGRIEYLQTTSGSKAYVPTLTNANVR